LSWERETWSSEAEVSSSERETSSSQAEVSSCERETWSSEAEALSSECETWSSDNTVRLRIFVGWVEERNPTYTFLFFSLNRTVLGVLRLKL